jgi:hypothetical protein
MAAKDETSIMRVMPSVMTIVVMLLAFSHSATAVETTARPALLKALDGQWTMVGDVKGKPVQYDMEAFPTLQGTFTEMHMNDVHVPSRYEARVFIGADKGGQLIVHWLDSFGAKYSVPHGTGAITGNAIIFNIPYPSGQFRDTLTYQPTRQVWTLLIEAAKPDGSWGHFAQYEIRRKPAGTNKLAKPTH